MSWIDDAKKNAQAELQKEKNKRERKEAADKLAADLEHARKVAIFHRYTDQTRQEIEKVLSEARQQGLSVSEAVEGHHQYRHKEAGRYDGFSIVTDYISNSFDVETETYTYAIKWIVTEPSTQKTLDIYLGLEQSWKRSLFGTITIPFTPTNSAQNVELCIKNWLKGIFKEQ